ncbi:MAG TPA: amino acid carrier protein [Phycisphaerales bacterium]|nr:amino acid carrier protein [Phycisphaerales bacterium]HMP36704.1 amino acid carrier protein [Phycisphaerales bacterium]
MDALISLYRAVVEPFTDNVLWGVHTFIVLLGVGLLFTIWSKFIQWRALTHGVTVVRGVYDDRRDPGAINHFQALSTALSATVGLGNIGGVALAIGVGGPGACFWMWVVGILGMAIKSVEVTLAMLFRDTSDPDNPRGGAMYVVTRGWGDRVGGIAKPISWAIGAIFCVTLLVSTMTGGNMFQVWNVANITNTYFGVHQIVVGITLATLTGLVIIGGIRRIGAVAGRVVPLMCALYILACLVVVAMNLGRVPELLAFIVRDAFTPTAAGGAFLGSTAWFGLTVGLRRALFSNEAGQGSSPIAHSAAKTDEPVREGVVAGLEPFIDTCIVCTLTALVILATGTWNREALGSFRGAIDLTHHVETDEKGEERRFARVESAATLDALPPLPAPDQWLPGNRFFVLIEVDEADHRTLSTRRKLVGEVVRSPEAADRGTDREFRLSWDDAPHGARLVGDEVFSEFVGAALTGHAFDRAVPGLGKYLVTLACWLFAFSTMIAWSYYGEQGVVFLFGRWMILPYKFLFCALAIVASVPQFIASDAQLGLLADLGTGVMLFANVPIILLMSPLAIRAFRDYFARLREGRMDPPHAAPPITEVVEGRDVE